MGPFSGSFLGAAYPLLIVGLVRNRPPQKTLFWFASGLQAAAVWTWANFLHANVPAGKKPVRINMDETGIRLYSECKNGHMTLQAKTLKRSARSLTNPATRAQTRGMFSLLAFICDDATIQHALPQIVLVKNTHMAGLSIAEMRSELPENTVLWTAQKAWMTGDLMCRAIRVLHKHLKKYMRTCQFILSSDAFRAHLTRNVWRTLARKGFMYHLIPAKMTWVMQPCDTHVFASLKRVLLEETQTLALRTADGRLTMKLLFAALALTIGSVLRGTSWRQAFWDLGLTGTQACLSETLLDKLMLRTRPRVPSTMPTLQHLQHVFPARAILPIDDIFAFFTVERHDSDSEQENPAAAADAQPPPNPDRPWLYRLRSGSALLNRPPHLPAAAPACPAAGPNLLTAAQPPARMSSALPRGQRLLPGLPRPAPRPPAPEPAPPARRKLPWRRDP